MKHVFAIKDFNSTAESAKRIIEKQVSVILKAKEDLDIDGINVFINDSIVRFYDETKFPDVKFIPSLQSSKKNKIPQKQTFAAFHNSVVNGIAKALSANETIVHIQDGTLDLTDIPSERGILKTRLGEMIEDVVYLMDLLDHPVWFNTASDKGNMKFGHYYTLIDILNIDNNCMFESVPNCFMFAGNSNLDWIIVNSAKYREIKMPSLMMNSIYEYDFLSIKELISKFANFGNGYYENMFPTIPTEIGSYFRNEKFDKDFYQYDMTKYKENFENFKKNLEEYKNPRIANVNTAVSFVRNTILNKLSKDDKVKLQLFERGL